MVGGGAVGIELSGEIKTDYPDKKVRLPFLYFEFFSSFSFNKFHIEYFSS